MNRPETILMTADPVGGVWTYAMELCRTLCRRGIRIHLATMGRHLSPGQRETADAIDGLTVEESNYALEWMEDPWEEVDRAGDWLMELKHRIQPDLVHLNNYAHASLPWDVPVLVVAHSCVLSWWEAVKGAQAPESWDTYARRVHGGLQAADGIVGVTHHMLDRIEHFYGPLPRTGVIYNARDSRRFSPAEKKPVIFSMGRLWDEAKNIGALQSASEKLPWPVYLAGEDRGRLTNNRENLHLLGHLESSGVTHWLGQSEIYVMPARYEPFGLSVLEAALSGCALVLGDIPTLREVWGDAATYADPDDPGHLQYQIRILCASEGKRRRIAEKARVRAQRYTPEIQADKYLRCYRRLQQSVRRPLMAAG